MPTERPDKILYIYIYLNTFIIAMRYNLLLLLLLTISTAVRGQNQESKSKVETKTIHSKILNADRDYTIYLPKDYANNPQKKYPILYILHGLSGVNTTWFENYHVKEVQDQLAASGESVEMIIVSPNAGGDPKTEWNGYFDMPGWNYEQFFYKEFLPHIESNYRVIGNKQNRAIAGLSMGGGGSTSYAQRHADMFSSVYAMSALMALPNNASQPTEDNKYTLLSRSVIENSCVDYVINATEQQKEELRSVQWFVDCGDDDFLLDANIDFFRAMRKAKIPVEFRIRDGAHDSLYWHSALFYCLPFVSRNFQP